ncbi:MAG TPA: glycosyltransferase family 4 protein [Solirubrobacteraceae bacterium]
MTRPPHSLRIALADSRDPQDMGAGSGASASLLEAMQELVAEALPVSGELPGLVGRIAHLSSVAARLRPRDLPHLRASAKRFHAAAQLGRPTIAARQYLVRRRLPPPASIDGVVQRGSEMRLPRGYHYVTLEDSTVLQALESYPWAHLDGLSHHGARIYAERQRQIYESAVACCCATHWVADSIVTGYGIPAERVHTVGLGRNHDISAENGRDWTRPRFLFVGVDWQRKNGPAVLSAFARVRETHPEAQLDVVGGHPRIEQPGVTPHGPLSLVYPGERRRLAALYGRATAFVMPSLHEPAGIVHAEAGGAGVASIGTTDGGAATMIGPGGILVDPRKVDELVAAMERLADPQTAQQLGDLARRHAALLTWRKVAERVVRALAIPGVDTSGLAEFL